MDSYHSSGLTDDVFGFVPPDFIYGLNKMEDNRFSSKEERERYYYNLDHERDRTPH